MTTLTGRCCSCRSCTRDGPLSSTGSSSALPRSAPRYRGRGVRPVLRTANIGVIRGVATGRTSPQPRSGRCCSRSVTTSPATTPPVLLLAVLPAVVAVVSVFARHHGTHRCDTDPVRVCRCRDAAGQWAREFLEELVDHPELLPEDVTRVSASRMNAATRDRTAVRSTSGCASSSILTASTRMPASPRLNPSGFIRRTISSRATSSSEYNRNPIGPARRVQHLRGIVVADRLHAQPGSLGDLADLHQVLRRRRPFIVAHLRTNPSVALESNHTNPPAAERLECADALMPPAVRDDAPHDSSRGRSARTPSTEGEP